MGLEDAAATIETATNAVAAANGDMIYVCVREIIATPATPSGTGLPAFTLIDLTGGNANNGADTVRAAWYRTKCGISFNDTLVFANSAFGYLVYVYSGLVTTGSNGADSVLQAVGHYDNTQDNPATISITIGSSDIGVCGWIGFAPSGDVTPTTAGSGWTTDADLYDAGDTIFAVGQSRTGADTEASIAFTANTAATHGVALELQVDTPPPPGGDIIQSSAGGYVGLWPFGLVA